MLFVFFSRQNIDNGLNARFLLLCVCGERERALAAEAALSAGTPPPQAPPPPPKQSQTPALSWVDVLPGEPQLTAPTQSV